MYYFTQTHLFNKNLVVNSLSRREILTAAHTVRGGDLASEIIREEIRMGEGVTLCVGVRKTAQSAGSAGQGRGM